MREAIRHKEADSLAPRTEEEGRAAGPESDEFIVEVTMKGYDVDGNVAVIKMATLNITGNVININWFKHIQMESGKPDTIAIMLLSDIVYWYRPIEVRDELTGDVVEMRKKFSADKLQRSYGAFADLYGYTKEQVKEALKRLEDKGLIDLDFRHPTVNGQKLGNVLYIGLKVERLKEITTPLLALKHRGYGDESIDPISFKADTNTEITTETTTEISQEEGARNPLFSFYENKIGLLTPIMADALEKAEKVYTSKWVADAIELAAKNGARHWNYCEKVLERWKREGRAEKKQPAAIDRSKYLNDQYADLIEH
jgi:DnaD/phage-associated family protein